MGDSLFPSEFRLREGHHGDEYDCVKRERERESEEK